MDIKTETKLIQTRRQLQEAKKVVKNKTVLNRLDKLSKGVNQVLTKQGLL